MRVAPETIRTWLRAYRKSGLDALHPRVRADHGLSHALPRQVSDLLIAIKDDNRDLSVQLVIREALASGKVPEGLPLAPSTVHRLLSRAGLMARAPNAPSSKDHRRFAFDTLLALFRASLRTDENRATPWRDLMHWLLVALVAATAEHTTNLRRRELCAAAR